MLLIKIVLCSKFNYPKFEIKIVFILNLLRGLAQAEFDEKWADIGF
jgi:hypothetical protein